MRKIGFGLTRRIVKGNKYLYVWRIIEGKRVEKVVQNEGMALQLLREYAENARRDALSYIDNQLFRFEKELGSSRPNRR